MLIRKIFRAESLSKGPPETTKARLKRALGWGFTWTPRRRVWSPYDPQECSPRTPSPRAVSLATSSCRSHVGSRSVGGWQLYPLLNGTYFPSNAPALGAAQLEGSILDLDDAVRALG